MIDGLYRIISDIKTAITTGVGTTVAGVTTIADKIPQNIGLIASTIGAIGTIIFIVVAIRRDRRDERESRLRIAVLEKQLGEGGSKSEGND